MATTNYTMRMDESLKNQLQDLVSNLGLDISTFFTLAAKQAVREQAIPFKITLNTPNQRTLEAIAEVEYMIKHKAYNSFADLMNDLGDEEDD